MIHESKSNEERSHQHLTDFLPLVSGLLPKLAQLLVQLLYLPHSCVHLTGLLNLK